MELIELKTKHEAYVKAQAEKIINEMKRRGVTTDTLHTCDYRNWDRELHNTMPEIVKELAKNGISSRSSVNWGVTDWVFTFNS